MKKKANIIDQLDKTSRAVKRNINNKARMKKILRGAV
jgi:hypothetical protein